MKFKQISIIIILVILTASWLWFDLNHQSDYLQVHFLNIGQGDAILIRAPSGENILIDGGPDNLLLHELSEVLPWWERKIDYLVISHYHDDHYSGWPEVLNKYQVGEILTTAHQPDDLLFKNWQEKLTEHNLTPTIVQVGETWKLGDISWQIISADSHHEDYNDNSLVLRLSYKEIDFLFTGDLTSIKELDLINSNLILESEILKVGHHGSKYSSSLEFLQAVKPQGCFVQVGEDNKFNHPHQEALDRLAEVDCQVYRNDLLGLISLISDGSTWWIDNK